MGLLDNLERGLEKAVRGLFSAGRGSVQPVELAAAIRRHMDNNSYALSEVRTVAPNVFTVRLSETDFEKAQQWGTTLAEELCDVVIDHARANGYTLYGAIRVSFTQDLELRRGSFEIDTAVEKGDSPKAATPSAPPAPAAPKQAPTRYEPVLEIDGQRHGLGSSAITIGRGDDADITVNDTGVSRKHLQISPSGGGWQANDLGSTNGTYLNGERLNTPTTLHDGSVLTLGRTRVVFRQVPIKAGRA
ncbi:FhaA domain-containing protein [Micrococcoides hystricis]|uniref:FhaA domain-containing protein n=1 Tax=Micrococcoides hystricis TaxID=1572761 RepID=A0ABV6PBG0_9MICC